MGKERGDVEVHEDAPIMVYFGSLSRSAFTLFMAIAGGIDWENAFFPLSDIGFIPASIFVFFILFSSLCMMNVIVGIFCQSAMEAYEQDKENIVETTLNERKMHVAALTELFCKWDTEGDGVIG